MEQDPYTTLPKPKKVGSPNVKEEVGVLMAELTSTNQDPKQSQANNNTEEGIP